MNSLYINPNERGLSNRPYLELPPTLFEDSVLLPDSARTNGTFLIAPTGWGKSMWLANQAHQDLMRGVGTVILDAVGGTIDNCLNKLLYLDKDEQIKVSERVVYCNMAGYRVGASPYDTLVTSWPMLQKKYKDETLDETAQRIVDLIAKTNKALAQASVQGLPRVVATLTSIFQVLASLNLPINKAIDFLQNPENWRNRIEIASRLHPEIEGAKNRLLSSFLNLTDTNRQNQAEVILNRLQRIEFDVVAEAMFSASKPLIDWDDVVENGKQVLIDLRYERSLQAKEFKLFWVWGSIYEYIKSSDSNGRVRPPLSVVIDELSYFVRGTSLNKSVITEEFRELMQVYKRNANIWFTAATQEAGELPPDLERACLKCGTHLYGAIDNPETAKRLTSRRSWDVEPHITGYKRVRSGIGEGFNTSTVMRDVPVYETTQDIQKAYAEQLQGLTKGQWLAAVSQNEGEPPTRLELIETEHMDQGRWVNKDMVDELKRYFMERDGIPVRDILRPASGSQAPINLLEKARGDRKDKQREVPAQDNSNVAEEHQQALPEATDAPQVEAPPEKKKKDRRRRVKES